MLPRSGEDERSKKRDRRRSEEEDYEIQQTDIDSDSSTQRRSLRSSTHSERDDEIEEPETPCCCTGFLNPRSPRKNERSALKTLVCGTSSIMSTFGTSPQKSASNSDDEEEAGAASLEAQRAKKLAKYKTRSNLDHGAGTSKGIPSQQFASDRDEAGPSRISATREIKLPGMGKPTKEEILNFWKDFEQGARYPIEDLIKEFEKERVQEPIPEGRDAGTSRVNPPERRKNKGKKKRPLTRCNTCNGTLPGIYTSQSFTPYVASVEASTSSYESLLSVTTITEESNKYSRSKASIIESDKETSIEDCGDLQMSQESLVFMMDQASTSHEIQSSETPSKGSETSENLFMVSDSIESTETENEPSQQMIVDEENTTSQQHTEQETGDKETLI